ncbi:MAG: hypothetical protein PW734_09675 [Verrucomicrobium sp.]|nr:hypothetical protein [Verrucomicrobium sp.]
MWYLPGPNFGYTLIRIDAHPWKTLLTMKEVLKLDPGSLLFTGADAKTHRNYWLERHPELFEENRSPVFELDTTPVHPHSVESAPRRPFQPWKAS